MTLGKWLTDRRLLTAPAIWGKLPGHADFVRHGVRRGEGAAWQAWLGREGALQTSHGKRAARIPISFIVPPGSLPFARRRFVLGAMLASHDRVGRPCPLVVYQIAHPQWTRAYLHALDRDEGWQTDWVFQLTRLLAGHFRLAEPRIEPLAHAVDAAWHDVAPSPHGALAVSRIQAHALSLARLPRPANLREPSTDASLPDPAADLQGTHFFPWTDWPDRLMRSAPKAVFWRQDAAGGFLDVGERLQALWKEDE